MQSKQSRVETESWELQIWWLEHNFEVWINILKFLIISLGNRPWIHYHLPDFDPRYFTGSISWLNWLTRDNRTSEIGMETNCELSQIWKSFEPSNLGSISLNFWQLWKMTARNFAILILNQGSLFGEITSSLGTVHKGYKLMTWGDKWPLKIWVKLYQNRGASGGISMVVVKPKQPRLQL